MIIPNFFNLILIFTVFYALRYFFEPKVKEKGIKKLVIDIVITAMFALIVQQVINLLII